MAERGRPRVEAPDDFGMHYAAWRAGKTTAADLYRKLGLSKSTFYRRVEEHEAAIEIRRRYQQAEASR